MDTLILPPPVYFSRWVSVARGRQVTFDASWNDRKGKACATGVPAVEREGRSGGSVPRQRTAGGPSDRSFSEQRDAIAGD